jgi:DNA mismatch endonuclease (patch repair protein)
MKKCLCGCGIEINEKSIYKKGHFFKGKKFSEDSKLKISETRKRLIREGKIVMPDTTGYTAWNKGKHLSEEHKRKSSETRKKLFHEGKLKIPNNTGKPNRKGVKASEETKRKSSETRKRLIKEGKVMAFGHGIALPTQAWNKGKKNIYSDETKQKMSNSFKRVWSSPEYRTKMSNTFKKRIKNPIFLAKRREIRMKTVMPKKDSSIEIKLQNILKNNCIKFEKHKAIMGQPDIFIEPNICIFTDGCYWHGCEQCLDRNKHESWIKSKKVKDLIITQWLYNEGYIVLRFWEHEINNNIDDILQKIKEGLHQETII